jgi:transposase
MIKDGQVRKLRRLLDAGSALTAAARRTGMDDKTARKYRDSGMLPSEQVRQRGRKGQA